MFEWMLHWLGFGLCHQIPARSFFGGGYQLPVCARDTGIYIGFVVSLAIIAFFERGRRGEGFPHPALIVVGVAFVALMGWDGVSSYAGWRSTTNDLRLLTGILAGWALPLAVAPLVNASLWTRNDPARILSDPAQAIGWVGAAGLTFAAAKWVLPLLGAGFALLSAASIIVTFVSVNLIVALLIPSFERRATRLRDAWAPILVALGISVLEVGAAAGLRVLLQSLARVF